MKDWIAIFRTGTHKDSNGNTKTWTEADLDRMVAAYNPAYNEAPVVIGHPRDNDPAYGWVSALSRKGGMLYARLKDLVPQFVEAVEGGIYKKRSISIYPDGSLRHVGFLGALPPAVKGLPDFSFSAGPCSTIEFAESHLSEIRAEIEQMNKEDAFLKSVASLASEAMSKDRQLTFGQAFKKILDERPEIAKGIQEIESYQMTRRLLDMRSGDLLDYLVKLKRGENPDFSYSQSFAEVQLEYPGLVIGYIEEGFK